MTVLKMFNRGAPKPDKAVGGGREKTTARLNQITSSVCRRGSHNDVKCSPYVPCMDVCPVIMPPPVIDVQVGDLSLEELAEQLSSIK